jgi:putative ABC transport system permease protein
VKSQGIKTGAGTDRLFMTLIDTLRIAIRALLKNKLRASLTVLGVVIGIAAVTTMVSIGQSAGRLVQGQFEALGTNVIVVLPGSSRRGGVRQSGVPSLTSEDSEAMSRECPAVLASSPIVGSGGQVISGNENWSPK